MSLNLGVLYTHILWVAVSVIVLVVVKALVLYVLARLNGMRSSERMQFAGVLSRGRVRVRTVFNRVLAATVSGRSNGAAAGGCHAIDDDHAAIDEAD